MLCARILFSASPARTEETEKSRIQNADPLKLATKQNDSIRHRSFGNANGAIWGEDNGNAKPSEALEFEAKREKNAIDSTLADMYKQASNLALAGEFAAAIVLHDSIGRILKLKSTEKKPSQSSALPKQTEFVFALDTVSQEKSRNNTGSKGKTIIPINWCPNENHYSLAMKLGGRSREWVNLLADNMRDWSLENNNKKINWDATLRVWIRKEYQKDQKESKEFVSIEKHKRSVPLVQTDSIWKNCYTKSNFTPEEEKEMAEADAAGMAIWEYRKAKKNAG